MSAEQEHDVYFRKNFCNNDFRSEIKELPEHLVDACHKMNIDPKEIHVFKEDSNPSYCAHAIGANIMLTNGFWKLDKEKQTWYFAHELSHVKHQDTEPVLKNQKRLVDFHIISSGITGALVAAQVYCKRLTLYKTIHQLGALGAANIAALYAYYQTSQQREFRANDEASRAVGTDAAIEFMKEARWKRDHSQNITIHHRLSVYKTWLGFNEHASCEAELAELEKIKREMEQKA